MTDSPSERGVVIPYEAKRRYSEKCSFCRPHSLAMFTSIASVEAAAAERCGLGLHLAGPCHKHICLSRHC